MYNTNYNLKEEIYQYSQKENYIYSLHGQSDKKSWITIASKNPNFKQWHYNLKNLLENIDIIGEQNAFISMNTFYKTYRRIEYLRNLHALFIDVDFYNTIYNKEQILMQLEEEFFNKTIPIPTFIIWSGRGLYLIWLIDSVPSQALPLWTTIEKYLYYQLKELGADRKAIDCTRVLRIPQTINTKNNSKVKILKFNDIRYTLRDIQREYLPDLSDENQKKKGRKKKIVYVHRERSLYYTRLLDLVTLCKIRNFDVKGLREIILFLYRYWACCFIEDITEALRQTLEFNEQFKNPLKESEVISATRSAEKAFKSENKGYRYKNDTLIELLQITSEEQKKLRTIISRTEYKIRDNEKNKERYRGKNPIVKYNKVQKIKAIKELFDKGLKQVDIATKLGISTSRVSELVKEIRTK